MIISGCYFTPYSIKAISAGGWGGGLCPAPYQQRAYSKHRARLTGGTVPGSSVLYLLGVGARTILYYVDNIYMHFLLVWTTLDISIPHTTSSAFA